MPWKASIPSGGMQRERRCEGDRRCGGAECEGCVASDELRSRTLGRELTLSRSHLRTLAPRTLAPAAHTTPLARSRASSAASSRSSAVNTASLSAPRSPPADRISPRRLRQPGNHVLHPDVHVPVGHVDQQRLRLPVRIEFDFADGLHRMRRERVRLDDRAVLLERARADRARARRRPVPRACRTRASLVANRGSCSRCPRP